MQLSVTLFLSIVGLSLGAPIEFHVSSPPPPSTTLLPINAPAAPTDEIKSCTIPQEDPEPLQDRASLANMTLIAMSGNMKLHPHWCPYKLKNVFQYIAYETATVLSSDNDKNLDQEDNLNSRRAYASCLSQLTKEKCEERGESDKRKGLLGCGWCAIANSNFHSKLGKGTCLVEPLYQRCATHQRTVYPYLMDLVKTTPLPSNEEFGACLQFGYPDECKSAKVVVNGATVTCAPCYAPTVFHLSTNVVCLPAKFADAGCNKLKEGIPDELVTKVAREGEIRSCWHGEQEKLSGPMLSLSALTYLAKLGDGKNFPQWCPSKLRNIYQFMVVAPGTVLRSNFNNATEGMIAHCSCQQYPTKDQCVGKQATFGGEKCKWCSLTNSAHHERLGEGTCLMEMMAQGYSYTNGSVFPRLMLLDKSINIPDGPAQAACLFHSHDKKKCETGKHATFDKKREFECKHIEIPPVYNLVPSSLCIQKDIADLLLEQLKDVPDKVIKKFNEWTPPTHPPIEGSTTTTTTTTRSTPKITTTPKSTSSSYPRREVKVEGTLLVLFGIVASFVSWTLP